jgi:hypothetical protein
MDKINWQYFFGGSGGNTFDRYYEADFRGMRVEKHSSNRGSEYAVGNIDKAKKKYKTEDELIAAIDKFLTVNKPLINKT